MQDCNRLSIRPEWDLSHYRWGMVSDTQLSFYQRGAKEGDIATFVTLLKSG